MRYRISYADMVNFGVHIVSIPVRLKVFKTQQKHYLLLKDSDWENFHKKHPDAIKLKYAQTYLKVFLDDTDSTFILAGKYVERIASHPITLSYEIGGYTRRGYRHLRKSPMVRLFVISERSQSETLTNE